MNDLTRRCVVAESTHFNGDRHYTERVSTVIDKYL